MSAQEILLLVKCEVLQPSLSKRVIVNGHGCHTALHFGVKVKESRLSSYVVLVT